MVWRDKPLLSQVMETYVSCSETEQDAVLYYLLAQHPGRTLVFVNAISSVRRLAALLRLLRLPVQVLHASQQQRQRLRALDRFKGDPDAVMVATDVAARGLDIQVSRPPLIASCPLREGQSVLLSSAGSTASSLPQGLRRRNCCPPSSTAHSRLCGQQGMNF